MKNGRHRFVRLAWFGLTSIALASMFVACESSESAPRSPVVTSNDASFEAAPTEPADAGADSSPEKDATIDVIADVGKDAFVAVHADVTTEFSTLANPTGAWTYGYTHGDPTGADAGALVVFSTVSNATPMIPAWYDPMNVNLGAPAAWRNDSAAADSNIAPGEFAMHPGNAGEYVIVRWRAPAAGAYTVTLQFKTGDSGDTNGLLLRNGVVVLTEDSTSTNAVHELDVTLAAGDYLDVAVGSKGDFLFDSTPVHLTIRTSGSDP